MGEIEYDIHPARVRRVFLFIRSQVTVAPMTNRGGRQMKTNRKFAMVAAGLLSATLFAAEAPAQTAKSLADTVAATRRALALQDRPTVLVGHSRVRNCRERSGN